MIEKVRQTIIAHDLLADGDRVLAAFSGGPDSMAMLHVLTRILPEWNGFLGAVYIDHRLRPRTAKREAAACREVCQKMKIPFFFEEIDIPRLRLRERAGIEETARKYRYTTLERLADREGFDKIAVGSHSDDRAETILFNLLRGSGRAGGIGFAPRRGRIIRPLFDCRRDEIIDFLKTRRITWLVDSSNRSSRFTRNRIRNRLLTLATKIVTPAASANLVRFADILAEEERFLQDKTGRMFRRLHSATPGGKNRLDLRSKLAYDVWLKRRLVMQLLTKAGFFDIEYAQVDRLLVLIDDGAGSRRQLPDGFVAEYAQGFLYIYQPGKEIEPLEAAVPGTCRPAWPQVQLEIAHVRRPRNFNVSQSGRTVAYGDADRIEPPLIVGGIRKGARFHPFGRPGVKKVGDFLTDIKYPRPLRDELPVVYDRRGVVWLAGVEIDERIAVTNRTRKIIRFEIKNHRASAQTV